MYLRSIALTMFSAGLLSCSPSGSSSKDAAGNDAAQPPIRQIATSQEVWKHCAFCHSPDGMGTRRLDAPMIAGQEKWYTARQLENFLQERRGFHPEDIPGYKMSINSGPLVTKELITELSDFIEKLPLTPQTLQPYSVGRAPAERPYEWTSRFAVTTTGEPANVGRGRELFAVCAACHGQRAEGTQAMQAPRLDNKQAWYLIRQLKYFKYGARGVHPDDIHGKQMAAAAANLKDDQDIIDVVAYIMTMTKGLFPYK